MCIPVPAPRSPGGGRLAGERAGEGNGANQMRDMGGLGVMGELGVMGKMGKMGMMGE